MAPTGPLYAAPELRLALDIDGTITADPSFFAALAGEWTAAGREVHIVSSRSQEVRRETVEELKGYKIPFAALHLTPPISAAQTLCPHQELDWYEQWLWLKVGYALSQGITHVVEDDPKVLALYARFAPAISAFSFTDRRLMLSVPTPTMPGARKGQ